jgi:hypothetical protein
LKTSPQLANELEAIMRRVQSRMADSSLSNSTAAAKDVGHGKGAVRRTKTGNLV